MGVVPFFAYATVFLIIPTGVVIVGAFLTPGGGFTLSNLSALGSAPIMAALQHSIVLSLVTALAGGVLGAVRPGRNPFQCRGPRVGGDPDVPAGAGG